MSDKVSHVYDWQKFKDDDTAQQYAAFKRDLLSTGTMLTQFNPNAINVPVFARLTDYVGIWAMEPTRLSCLWEMVGKFDLKSHFGDAKPIESSMTLENGPQGKTIAKIGLTGVLMKGQSSIGGTSTVQARRDIRSAASDPNIAGILLNIDSPGGTVAGTFELAADIKAARRQKPVYAQIEDLGASAAYWAASQADAVFAGSPTTLVGSIGTLQVIQDMSGMAEKAGIRTLVFGTGPFKGLGTPGAPVTEDQANHVQALVESVQQSFDSAVMKGRGLTQRQLTDVRHGGVLTATDALNSKLIDGIQPIGTTIIQLSNVIKQNSMRAETALPMRQLGGLPMLQRVIE